MTLRDVYFVQYFSGQFSTDNFVLIGDQYVTFEPFTVLPGPRNSEGAFGWLSAILSDNELENGKRNYKSAFPQQYVIIKSKNINFKIVTVDKIGRTYENKSHQVVHVMSTGDSGSYISEMRLNLTSKNPLTPFCLYYRYDFNHFFLESLFKTAFRL